jgi:hypothetical protein
MTLKVCVAGAAIWIGKPLCGVSARQPDLAPRRAFGTPQ